jgi:hypothetical protein
MGRVGEWGVKRATAPPGQVAGRGRGLGAGMLWGVEVPTRYRGGGHLTRAREVTAVVLAAKSLDPLDHALAEATVKRTRDVLLLCRRKGIVRLVGLQRTRSARWALLEG